MTKTWLVHFVAYCQNCDWQNQDYIDGPRLAAKHARQKKHLVDADKGYAIHYDGRPMDQNRGRNDRR